MSQIIGLITDFPLTGWAMLAVAGVWALLVITTALVATFHDTPARQDAALRVLGVLLRHVPSGRDDVHQVRR